MRMALLPLLVIYGFGLIGLSIDSTRSWFLAATPLNLVLTIGLFLWANKDYRKYFLLVCGLIYAACFFIEVAGVYTKAIFGSYEYGNALGPKWLQVPLLIGANWLLLVLATAGMVAALKIPVVLKWMLGATLMTALDWLIEPIAIRLDFWHWHTSSIPVQNYIAWWVVSLLMHALLFTAKPRLNRGLSTGIFLLQVAFFAGLHLLFAVRG